MITLQTQKMNPISFESRHKKSDNKEIKSDSNQDNNLLNASLLGLALIGMSVLPSCVKLETIYPEAEPFATEEVSKLSNATKFSQYNSDRTEDILRAMGALVSPEDSLCNIKSISCKDKKGTRYFIKPTYIGARSVKVKGMELYSDFTGGNIYDAVITNSEDGGIIMNKTFEDGNKETLKYILNDKGEVEESLFLGDTLAVENSIFKKLESGEVLRTFANGKKVVYSNFTNDMDYPIPIAFDASVNDWEDGGTSESDL